MKKLILASLSAALISACGFTPLHQSQSSVVGQSYGKVRIKTLNGANPDDKEAGFQIMQDLIDRIGQGSGEHVLEISPRLRQRRLGVTGDDIASRFTVSLRADYRLIETKTGNVLDRGRLSSETSFGAPTDPFGRVSAEENASERIANEIADDFVILLSKYYSAQGS